MAKISLVIPDQALSEIDASSGGNRTAFMVAAALERAREVRRKREDQQIAHECATNAQLDAELAAECAPTSSDGIC